MEQASGNGSDTFKSTDHYQTNGIDSEHTLYVAGNIHDVLPSLVATEVERVEAVSKAAEDTRAMARNRNRMLTLFVTLLAEIIMPIVVLPHLPIPATFAAQAMILLITLPDAAITFYAYLRKY